MAVCLVVVSFVGCSKEWTLFMLTLGVCLEGALFSGSSINQLDLAPNFAGTLFGIINGIASINGSLTPLVVAYLTEGQVISIECKKKGRSEMPTAPVDLMELSLAANVGSMAHRFPADGGHLVL